MPARVAAAQPAAVAPPTTRTRGTTTSSSSITNTKRRIAASASSEPSASTSAAPVNGQRTASKSALHAKAARPPIVSQSSGQTRSNSERSSSQQPPHPSKPTPVAARTTTTAKSTQVKAPVCESLSQEALIGCLREGTSVTTHTLVELLRHLNVTLQHLALQPLLSLPSDPTSHPSGSRESSQTNRTARLAFNAVMQALASLITAGWRMTAAEADKQMKPRPRNVLNLVDAFRIACRVVFSEPGGEADRKDTIKKSQMALSVLKRLAALEIHVALPSELAFLHSEIHTRIPALRTDQHVQTSLQADSPSHLLLRFRYGTEIEDDESLIAFILDYQTVCLGRIQMRQAVALGDVEDLVSSLANPNDGVMSWLCRAQHVAESPSHSMFPLLQRCSYQVEKTVSTFVTKLDESASSEGQTRLERQRLILRARIVGILALLASNMQDPPGQSPSAPSRRDPLLQKAARTIKIFWRECAPGDGASRQNAYQEAHSALLDIEGKLEQLDRSLVEELRWTKLESWGEVVRTWKWLAKQNADFATLERLEGKKGESANASAPESAAPKEEGLTPKNPRCTVSPLEIAKAYKKAQGDCSEAVIVLDMSRTEEMDLSDAGLQTLSKATSSLQGLERMRGEASKDTSDGFELLKVLERLLRRCNIEVSRWQSISNAPAKGPVPELAAELASMSIQDNRKDSEKEVIIKLMGACQEVTMHLLTTKSTEEHKLPTPSGDEGVSNLISYISNALQSARFLLLAEFELAGRLKDMERKAQASLLAATTFLSTIAVTYPEPSRASDNLHWLTVAQEARSLSSTASALGGRLYKEARYASAVSFMEPAARILHHALQFGSKDEHGSSTLCNRWEHAAICFRALSKHKDTLEALRQYLTAISSAQWEELETIARNDGPAQIFREDCSAEASQASRSSTPAKFDWTKFGRNLRMLAETSIFDLLASQGRGSTQGVYEILKASEIPLDAMLLCLEHIVTSEWLESRLHIDGGQDAAEAILEVCCFLLKPEARPLRRARILLRDLELRVFGARKVSEGKRLVEEIELLLDTPQLGLDEGLRPHIPVFRSQLHVLDVLLIHRLDVPSDESMVSSEELSIATKRACKSLRELLATEQSSTPSRSSTSISLDPKMPIGMRKGGVSKMSSGRSASSSDKSYQRREPLRKKNAPAQPSTPPMSSPVTPPRKGDYETLCQAATEPVTPMRKAQLRWPGLARLLALVDLLCHHLIGYGYCLGSLELAKVLRRLAGDDVDLWTRTTISVARQYLSLGRVLKATAYLNSASKYCTQPDQSSLVSLETRFSFLLAEASVFSQVDSTLDRALARYNDALEIGRSIERSQGKQVRGSGLSRAFMKIDSHHRISSAADTYAALMFAMGDLRSAIDAATHATAYATRAASVIALLTQPKAGDQSDRSHEDDPFVAMSSDPAQLAKDAQMQSLQAVPLRPASQKWRSTGFASTSLPSLRVAAAHWRVNGALLSCYQKLARLNEIRGTAGQADMFATEAVHLSQSLCLKLGLAQSLLLRAELRLQLGKTNDGEADVTRSLKVLSDVWLPEAAALACIQGDQFAKSPATYEEAIKAYHTGQNTLQALDKALAEIEQSSPSSRPSSNPKSLSPINARISSQGRVTTSRPSLTLASRADVLLPELQARLLRRQAWLLQALGRSDESEEVLAKVHAVEAVTGPNRIESHLMRGRIALQRALQHMQSDALWGMVPEAVISVPMAAQQASSGTSRAMTTSSSAASAKIILALLTKATSAFSLALSATSQSSSASLSLRHALQGLSVTATLQATIAEGGAKASNLNRAMALTSASMITLRREFIDAIWSKLETVSPADEKDHWAAARSVSQPIKGLLGSRSSSRPSLLAAGPVPSETESRRTRRAISEEPDSSLDDDEREAGDHLPAEMDEDAIMQKFWHDRRDQSVQELLYDEKSSRHSGSLPDGWTVVSVSLSRERNAIVLTRRSGCDSLSPLVFSLPIDRQAKREGEEEELTIDAALAEMDDIVSSSNRLTASAKNISDSAGMEARKAWWTGRRELDDRLKLLCESIEARWLGPFKSTFMDPLPVDKDSAPMTVLRSAFDRIVKRLCFPSGTLKKGPKIKLDDAILEIVAGLSSSSVTDEELEDLLHFVTDIHQFNGIPVAVDEADLDEITLDLRSALEEFRSACMKVEHAKGTRQVDHHIFLILDKDTAPFPWESIPCLRGRAVCRIPCMSFLHDRVEMARRLGATQEDDGCFHLPRACKTFYLLNPSGDLAKSQRRFEGYLRSLPNSRGLIGKPPGPNEYLDALSSHSLVLYFGHSGGEQYIKTTRLRALQRCAVTMLWGCSSAVLRDQGEYDRTGTPLSYLVAGAPAVVGQLFDATDKELDCLSESVLLHLGLKEAPSEDLLSALRSSKARFEVSSSSSAKRGILTDQGDFMDAKEGVKKMGNGNGNGKKGKGGKDQGKEISLSLPRAIAESRDCCRLPYLTGSAPVVYGVPVYFDR